MKVADNGKKFKGIKNFAEEQTLFRLPFVIGETWLNQ
jgi:hypothetical protein